MESEGHAIDQSGNECPGNAALPQYGGQATQAPEVLASRQPQKHHRDPTSGPQPTIRADRRLQEAIRGRRQPILSMDTKKKELIGNIVSCKASRRFGVVVTSADGRRGRIELAARERS